MYGACGRQRPIVEAENSQERLAGRENRRRIWCVRQPDRTDGDGGETVHEGRLIGELRHVQDSWRAHRHQGTYGEPLAAVRCRQSVKTGMRGARCCVWVLLLMLVSGCSPQQAAKTTPQPGPTSNALAGGCAGTVVTEAEPPRWAQSGWSHTNGAPWPVPWAPSTSSNALAFLFARHLVAGASPRVDGSSNKVLWLLRDGAAFVVEGRPLGTSKPVVSVDGGRSIVDAPLPGCWSFQLIPRGSAKAVGTINLDVLPAGSDPTKTGGSSVPARSPA